ncbi:swr1 complex subunit 6 [Phtheirospermum japonicum]|uniref:Swr1 complex subunit 6 n=1 Tax=Phtheirospermum japonicum TaxID=374723 RepID=A0A830CBV0_9LAMI|nr:swr1 complex subunit 6 [Phtheirospermum japonicum]
MDEEMSNSQRRMSTRTRKVASKMSAALASCDNRTRAMLARLEDLENDNAGMETVQVDEDDEASLVDDDQAFQKKQNKSTKRKKRQAKALENAKKEPRTFLEARRHFCTVCGVLSNYTCVQCGMRFCSPRCQNIHNNTRCLRFVA